MNKQITVLRIQSRICIGGPAIHTEILSKYLPAERYRTILLGGAVDDGEKSKFDDLKNQHIDIRIIDEMRRVTNPLNDLKAIWKIYRIIRQEKPSIVHTHTAKAGTVGRLAALLAGVPIIIHTFHGHTFDGYFSRSLTFFFKKIEQALAIFSTRIIAISPKQKYDLTEKYRIAPPHKVDVIRLGFELERLQHVQKSATWRTTLGIRDSDFILGIVGRLVPIKNIAMGIEVVQRLHEHKKAYHLCIIGDGPERHSLEQLSLAKGLNGYVHFLGWKTDIEEIYRNIDILLLTSINEGTPVAIVEAMACGVPVVATDVGGVADMIRHGQNGLLVRSGETRDMAEKIKLLMSQPGLAHLLTENARDFAFSTYGYSRLVDDIDHLYRDELARKNICTR